MEQKWWIKFSASKSSLVRFTRQRRQQTPPMIFLEGIRIPIAKEVKNLAIVFDKAFDGQHKPKLQ